VRIKIETTFFLFFVFLLFSLFAVRNFYGGKNFWGYGLGGLRLSSCVTREAYFNPDPHLAISRRAKEERESEKRRVRPPTRCSAVCLRDPWGVLFIHSPRDVFAEQHSTSPHPSGPHRSKQRLKSLNSGYDLMGFFRRSMTITSMAAIRYMILPKNKRHGFVRSAIKDVFHPVTSHAR
jgi:hypothetical protein